MQTPTTTWQPLAYRRREPKPPTRDPYAWALLLPALIYSVGVILYGGDVLLVNTTAATMARAAGSWLMLLGGEAGTVATAAEVFRKQREGEATRMDWVGMGASFGATFLAILVVQARMMTMDTWWTAVAQAQGPLLFAIASSVDFYATVMEYGFYLASYNARLARWEDGRYAHLLRERERKQAYFAQAAQGNGHNGADPREIAAPSAPSAQVSRRPAQIADWRAQIALLSARKLASLAQQLQRPDTDRAAIVNQLLEDWGYEVRKDSTARSWAAVLIQEAEARAMQEVM